MSNTKKKPEVVMIELVNTRDSGFVLDGTRGTDFEQRLDAPSACFLPNTGFMAGAAGELIEIRFIKNRDEIEVQKQNQLGFKPSGNKLEDKIILKNGRQAIVKDGGYAGLYDYIMKVFYQENAPGRPEGMPALFRVVVPGKKEEKLNEFEFQKSEAIQWLSQYYQKRGDKYWFDEQKIDSLCQMFIVYADSPQGKVNGLIAHINHDPVAFLDKAMKMEQTVVSELHIAIELNVVKFEKNTLVYSNKDKVIMDCGKGNVSLDKKIVKASEFLQSPENKEIYDEFHIELETAQEKALK